MSPRIYVGSLSSPATDTRVCLQCGAHRTVPSVCMTRDTITGQPLAVGVSRWARRRRLRK